METELKIQFPTIVKYDLEVNTYMGVFKNNENTNVFVQFHVPNYPNSKGITFKTSIEFPDSLLKTLETKMDVLSFLDYLKLFTQLLCKVNSKPAFNVNLFRVFYLEYKELKFKFPDEQFLFDSKEELFTIRHFDNYAIKNEVKIKLNFAESSGNLYEIHSCSFPEGSVKLFPKQTNLFLIHAQFLNYIESLNNFHYLMQRIDSVCWVTAPLDPSLADNFRTVVIADNFVTLKIIFDPWNTEKIPEFKFYGPSKSIEIHRKNLSENLGNWDPNNDILQNILNLLDIPFFAVKQTEDESETKDIVLYDQDNECPICFSYYLNEAVPDVICEFESCHRQFHNVCLFEWLSMMPNNQKLFGYIHGNCPNCEKVISCKVVEA